MLNIKNNTRTSAYLALLLAGVGRRGFGSLILLPFVLFAPTFVLNHVGRRDHPLFFWGGDLVIIIKKKKKRERSASLPEAVYIVPISL